MLALVDADPYGLKILAVYMKGERGAQWGGVGGGQGVWCAQALATGLLPPTQRSPG